MLDNDLFILISERPLRKSLYTQNCYPLVVGSFQMPNISLTTMNGNPSDPFKYKKVKWLFLARTPENILLFQV